MCPSGNVKFFNAGDAGSVEGAGAAGDDAALVAGAMGVAVAVDVGAVAGVGSVVPLVATLGAAAAGSAAGCAAHPAATRLTERPATVTAVKSLMRLEPIFYIPQYWCRRPEGPPRWLCLRNSGRKFQSGQSIA